jgi:hypothetical protein
MGESWNKMEWCCWLNPSRLGWASTTGSGEHSNYLSGSKKRRQISCPAKALLVSQEWLRSVELVMCESCNFKNKSADCIIGSNSVPSYKLSETQPYSMYYVPQHLRLNGYNSYARETCSSCGRGWIDVTTEILNVDPHTHKYPYTCWVCLQLPFRLYIVECKTAEWCGSWAARSGRCPLQGTALSLTWRIWGKRTTFTTVDVQCEFRCRGLQNMSRMSSVIPWMYQNILREI